MLVYKMLNEDQLVSPQGYRSAQVVCRQLGYTDGNVLAIRRSKIFGSDKRYPVLANRLRCKGDEQQITDCPGYWLHENVQQFRKKKLK